MSGSVTGVVFLANSAANTLLDVTRAPAAPTPSMYNALRHHVAIGLFRIMIHPFRSFARLRRNPAEPNPLRLRRIALETFPSVLPRQPMVSSCPGAESAHRRGLSC